MKKKLYLIMSLFLAMGPTLLLGQNSGTLIIKIGSLRNDNGQVAISIHNSNDGFPGGKESMIQAKSVKIKNGKAIAEFDNLPFGEYGVSAFHDENSNQEIDTNWLGIPKEGVGASNNAKGRMGPPKYEDAKFEFKNDGQEINFDMDYIF
jgi:uncharacterized protein (DUF2141 family)